jgi:hypothetical protein
MLAAVAITVVAFITITPSAISVSQARVNSTLYERLRGWKTWLGEPEQMRRASVSHSGEKANCVEQIKFLNAQSIHSFSIFW